MADALTSVLGPVQAKIGTAAVIGHGTISGR